MDLIRKARSRREVLSYLDEYLENLEMSNEGISIDEDFIQGVHVEILYEDGKSLYIDCNYSREDGRIPRQHIKAIMYDGLEETMVYGDYTISETGAVHID